MRISENEAAARESYYKTSIA